MVTPVHRFQPIECVAGQYAHSHIRRPPHRRTCLDPPAYRLDAVTNGLNVTTELPVRAHAVELDSSVFLDLPPDGTGEASSHLVQPPQREPCNHCSYMKWVYMVLLPVIVFGVILHFEYHDVLLFEAVVLSILIFFLIVYRPSTATLRRYSKATWDILSAAVTAPAEEPPLPSPIPSLQVIHTSTLDEPAQPLPPHMEPPPPPYHIAILLPQQINQEEVPPPSYDKAVS